MSQMRVFSFFLHFSKNSFILEWRLVPVFKCAQNNWKQESLREDPFLLMALVESEV